MQWLASLSVRRPVFATVMILVIVVVGIVGYKNLSLDRIPKVDQPIVTVNTSLPGATPEQVETQLSDKIEESITTISGIEELRSISTEGISQVVVSFNLDKNIDTATQEVRDHLSTVLSDLPEGTKTPVVSKLDPSDAPILSVALESARPVREVTEYADHELRQALENVSGVGQVSILGGRKRQLQVFVDANTLRAAGLAVCLPVAFMNSIPGRFLMSFVLTLAVAIAISLFVAFTLTPMLSSRWLRLDLRPDSERKKNVLERVVDVFYRPIERLYMAVLGWVVHPWRRWIVVAMCLVALGSIVPLAKTIPGGFLPKHAEAQFQLDLRT